jgi:hypothetical protein
MNVELTADQIYILLDALDSHESMVESDATLEELDVIGQLLVNSLNGV